MLIKGSDLTDFQRDQVLAAYVHRHTVENATRRGLDCVMCANSGGDHEIVIPAGQQAAGEVRKRWHDHHVTVQTDQQWLADHAFYFVANGSRLQHNRHAEPSYMAEAD
jgi:thiamine monophosphate kinase